MPTVYDYFQRACRRDSDRFCGISGEQCFDSDGNSAEFRLDARDGRIRSAQYRCTTCVTLVALCEHLAEVLTGSALDEASSWTPERLLALHPEIPAMRRDRATLAVMAVQSALQKCMEGACA